MSNLVVSTGRGIAAGIRARAGLFVVIAVAVLALDVFLPPLVLSLFRTPWTFFTFNPWLKQLPAYLASDIAPGEKLSFLSRVALFWFSADGPFGAPEWGFAVDMMDLVRFLGMSLLVATYFVLWLYRREHADQTGRPGRGAGTGGILGAVASVLGLTTGPCSVVGCGAPVLPVVGLVLAGLSSGTLALLSALSRVAVAIVLVALAAGVAYLGGRVGVTLQGTGTTTLRRSSSRRIVSRKG